MKKLLLVAFVALFSLNLMAEVSTANLPEKTLFLKGSASISKGIQEAFNFWAAFGFHERVSAALIWNDMIYHNSTETSMANPLLCGLFGILKGTDNLYGYLDFTLPFKKESGTRPFKTKIGAVYRRVINDMFDAWARLRFPISRANGSTGFDILLEVGPNVKYDKIFGQVYFYINEQVKPTSSFNKYGFNLYGHYDLGKYGRPMAEFGIDRLKGASWATSWKITVGYNYLFDVGQYL